MRPKFLPILTVFFLALSLGWNGRAEAGDCNSNGVDDLFDVLPGAIFFFPNVSQYFPPPGGPFTAETVAVGNFDGLSGPDLAVPLQPPCVGECLEPGEVAFYVNNPFPNGGVFTYQPAIDPCTPTCTGIPPNPLVGRIPFDIVAVDFDNDGYDDVATTGVGANGLEHLSVVLNPGQILPGVWFGFTDPATHYSLTNANSGYAITSADFNLDGFPDLAVATNASKVEVFYNDATNPGTFPFAASVYFVGGNSLSIEVGDFDQDGYPDIVTANNFADSVAVLRNNGDETFSPAQHFAVGVEPKGVAVADFDLDGFPDIATADLGGFPLVNGSVTILQNDSTGPGSIGFSLSTRFTTEFANLAPLAIEANDFDGDVVVGSRGSSFSPDLVVACQFADALIIIQNNGDGTFAPPQKACGDGTTGPIGSPCVAPVTGFKSIDSADLSGNFQNDVVLSRGSDFIVEHSTFIFPTSSDLNQNSVPDECESAPIVTMQPMNQEVCEGDPISFSVSVIGTDPLSYQWYREGLGLPIPGATTGTLTLPATSLSDSGNYFVRVTNFLGFADSDMAVLTVNSSEICEDCNREPDLFSVTGEVFGSLPATLGSAIDDVGDIDLDGFPDLLVGSPGWKHPTPQFLQGGAMEVLSGVDGSRIRIHIGTSGVSEQFGASVAGVGDLDNDSVPDYLVGAPFDNYAGADSGSVYLYSGIDGSEIARIHGSALGDRFGLAVSGAGDVNRDGVPDFMVAAPYSDANGTDSGKVTIYSGAYYGYSGPPPGGGPYLQRFPVLVGLPPGVLAIRKGESAGDLFGSALAGGGRVDGDLFDDVLIGAPQHSGIGRVYVYSWKKNLDVRVLDGEILVSPPIDSPDFGARVAFAGDLDGDAADDFIVGSPLQDTINLLDNRGAVRVFSGSDSSSLAFFTGESPGDNFGRSLDGGQDADNDGTSDFLIGAPGGDYNGIDSGRGYLFSGSDLSTLRILEGEAQGDLFGTAVSFGRDFSQDGTTDLVVGAPGNSGDAGRAYFSSGVRILCTSDPLSVSWNGGIQQLDLNAGPAHAGRNYQLVGSGGGISPGVVLAPTILPLNPNDSYYVDTLNNPNTPPLTNSLGVLDRDGKATVLFTAPNMVSLIGQTYYHAYFIYGGGQDYFASNAISVTIVP